MKRAREREKQASWRILRLSHGKFEKTQFMFRTLHQVARTLHQVAKNPRNLYIFNRNCKYTQDKREPNNKQQTNERTKNATLNKI